MTNLPNNPGECCGKHEANLVECPHKHASHHSSSISFCICNCLPCHSSAPKECYNDGCPIKDCAGGGHTFLPCCEKYNPTSGFGAAPKDTQSTEEYERGYGAGKREVIGKIGAKLLAKHSAQAILDAYFEAANEELEASEQENESNN